jgi:hypothetical protein
MMSDHEMGASEDLAAWLKDVGRRKWRPPQSIESNQSNRATESSEDLFRYLEELVGRELRTREDIRRYFDELSVENLEAGRTHRRRQIVKDTVLLLCLLTAYIQYNFLDVTLQIARLPTTLIFVPLDARIAPAPNSRHARWGGADQAGRVS